MIDTSNTPKKRRNKLLLWNRLMSRVVGASRAILVELKRVLRREESELYWAESAELGEKEKSRRLWHLFPIPGLSGDILAAKSARDAVSRKRSVSVRVKIIFFYVIIAVANTLMLFNVLLFAIQQTKYR